VIGDCCSHSSKNSIPKIKVKGQSIENILQLDKKYASIDPNWHTEKPEETKISSNRRKRNGKRLKLGVTTIVDLAGDVALDK
jgi:hypothetical protein